MQYEMRMEEFSYAYIHAVASVAGCGVDRPRVDHDSVDITIKRKGGNGKYRSPQIDAQIKCTGQQDLVDDNHIKFPLKIKNYNDLRDEFRSVPTILIVVFVPRNINHWLTQDEECLALSHCGYWVSLAGEPETNNTASKMVYVPRSQVFSVEELDAMMNRASNGEKI
ncbi:hypothetical protein J2129_000355 [Methanofollis sp. W23]|uniref:DUF4365 domain-containing protein n=1 Tax=Methanofollis sp. W23 TaxID=2817849 RepID=UPI001AE9F217|nr:DUF4365 domain-containing protein [Methanofollis sp. W23]MBP2144901.1 hypothetical protein [Methanofollis sp. W23]